MQDKDSEFHNTLHESWLDINPADIFRQRVMLFNRILRSTGDINGCRLLDVGAGSGYAGIWLAKRFPGLEVVALEASEKAAVELIPKMAQAHGVAGQVKGLHASFTDEIDTQKFDVVLSFGALHHSPDLLETMKNLTRVTRDEGWLFAHEPVMPDRTTNEQYVRKYESLEVKGDLQFRNMDRDDHFFRRSEYVCAAAHAGLDLIDEWKISNSSLWIRYDLDHRHFRSAAMTTVSVLQNKFKEDKQSPIYRLHNRYFAWKPSGTRWIPHVWKRSTSAT